VWFPIGGMLLPSSHLAQLSRYIGVQVQRDILVGLFLFSVFFARNNMMMMTIVSQAFIRPCKRPYKADCAGIVSRDRFVGVKNNHIFGIPDPNLPIHYKTFGVLRW